ncbi:MAG: hypothetical protein KAR09_02315 [Bacteroidales bacterium]|nr:hypothetical protein [Bacteroidales bacterium]
MLKMIFAPAIFFLLVFIPCHAQSQTFGDFKYDETELYAETKQVNQFFRRFNGEEDKQGERLYEKDRDFRTYKLRKKYVPTLFNLESSILNDAGKEKFSELVLEKDKPVFLDFHGGAWLCELNTLFIYEGREQELTLFLVLQEEVVGSKWVIDGVYFEPFYDLLKKPDNSNFNDSKFLHPLSHEVGFMNIFRVFNESDSLEYFGNKYFQPDYLSLFFYEIKKGRLEFKTVKDLKFHFFQIDGWYFELTYFNRAGYNSGWLISNLLEIDEKNRDILLNYIYHE